MQDANGGVLPGVTVTVTNTATGLVRTAVTGQRGPLRHCRRCRRARYEVRAELAGFKPHVRRDLELTVAETLALNITLQIGDVADRGRRASARRRW